ncbi:MAG TPA: PEP/pyruvate-binding domain-containing protein, partial [Propionibacteriaceae bacterium]|nr:PEP/pyruvate-binding domain-containing protein [Propionibacteriaceae bacterium]
MKTVVLLSDLTRNDLATAGGKGANLGELVRAGFPVPNGFVVTTDAYATVIQPLDLNIPERTAAGEGASVRTVIEKAPVPADLRTEIINAYSALGSGPVAVRSSATAEDLPAAAFAGQQDTYLNVVGEPALIDAVRRCWASLWTERAIAYRNRLKIDPAEVGIAVVVQRMINAEVAGVMFTADPVSGDRETMVVDASIGLGEAVVSGLVTPDHYVLDGRGLIRDYRPGGRELIVTSVPGGGVDHHAGQPDHTERLPDIVLTDLARLGSGVAKHFGRPQDIEWAYADGQLWLLQARPMTALPPPPVKLSAAQRRLGSVLLDYIPVRPYPIDMTTWVPYGPAGLMAGVTGRFGFRDAFEGFLPEDEYGVVDRFVPVAPRPTAGVLLAPWRIATLARRHDPRYWRDDRRFVDFLDRVHTLAAQDLLTMPWPQLKTMPRQALDLIKPIGDLRIDYLPRTGLAIARLFLALRLLRRSALFADLIVSPTRTTDANRSLEALAARARKDPRLLDAVNELDPQALAAFGDFNQEFNAYLAEYGHRETVTPVLVTPPTQGEAPETVLALIKVLAAEPQRPPEDPERAMSELLKHPLLRGPRQRARMERWVQAARAGITFREDSHFYFLMPLPILRKSLLEMGRRLRDVGVLDVPEAVFHLRLNELEAVNDPANLTESGKDQLRAAVRTRSGRREELSGVRLIDPAAVFPRREVGDALITGTPASSG